VYLKHRQPKQESVVGFLGELTGAVLDEGLKVLGERNGLVVH